MLLTFTSKLLQEPDIILLLQCNVVPVINYGMSEDITLYIVGVV